MLETACFKEERKVQYSAWEIVMAGDARWAGLTEKVTTRQMQVCVVEEHGRSSYCKDPRGEHGWKGSEKGQGGREAEEGKRWESSTEQGSQAQGG